MSKYLEIIDRLLDAPVVLRIEIDAKDWIDKFKKLRQIILNNENYPLDEITHYDKQRLDLYYETRLEADQMKDKVC